MIVCPCLKLSNESLSIFKIRRRASDSVSMSKTIKRITLNFQNHSIFKITQFSKSGGGRVIVCPCLKLSNESLSIFKIRRRASDSVSMSKTIKRITLNFQNHSIFKITQFSKSGGGRVIVCPCLQTIQRITLNTMTLEVT